MLTVNAHAPMVAEELIEAYSNVPAANLGHFLDTAMDPGIKPLYRPIKLIGTALTVQTTPDNTAGIRKAVEMAQPGDVLVVDRAGEMRHAVMGDFGVHGWIQNGVVGMVVDGLVTDRDGLERLDFPIFSRGVAAMLPKGQGPEAGGVNVPVVVGSVTVNPGDLILATRTASSSPPPRTRRRSWKPASSWVSGRSGPSPRSPTAAPSQTSARTARPGAAASAVLQLRASQART